MKPRAAGEPKKRILVACGTSIATSTIVAVVLEEKLHDQGIRNFEIVKCRVAELRTEIDRLRPDVVLTTTRVDPSFVKGVTYYPALSFLTGSEERDQIIAEISRLLRTAPDSKEAGG